ncbi:MAG: nucleoside-diphosphate kinase [Fidelibacterota bacterium]
MVGHRTLAIIKPDAIKKKVMGKIIDRILQAGFEITAARLVHLKQAEAETFYAVHRERPFFRDLVTFMTSGPCLPMVVEHENAVTEFRKLIGATNPAEAAPGTIRKDFADNVQNNAIHGSDSDTNAEKEIAFFFTPEQILMR